MKKSSMRIFAVILLAAAAVYVLKWTLSFKLGLLRNSIEGADFWGPVLFIIIYVFATVLAMPTFSFMTVIGGTLFNTPVAIVSAWLGAVIGASLSFLVARYCVRERATRYLSSKPVFQKISDLTEKNGIIAVAAVRLIPLFPFNLLNYAFGLTTLSFTVYAFWSAVFMLPTIVLYVVGTEVAMSAIDSGNVSWNLIGIAVLTFIVLALAVRAVKNNINIPDDIEL